MNDGKIGSTGMVKLQAKKKERRHRLQVQSLSFLPSDHGHCVRFIAHLILTAMHRNSYAQSCRLSSESWINKKDACIRSKDPPNQISHLFGDPSEDRFISLGRVLGAPCYRKVSFYYPKTQKPETKTKSPNPHRGQASASASFMSSLEVLSIVCISFGYYNPHHSEYVLQERAGVGSGGTRTAQTCEGVI